MSRLRSHGRVAAVAAAVVVSAAFVAPASPSAASLVCEGAASIESETVMITYDRDGSFRVDHTMRVRPAPHAALRFTALEDETMSVKSFGLFSIAGAARREVQPTQKLETEFAPAYVLVTDAKARMIIAPSVAPGVLIECVRSERHRTPLTWGKFGFDRDVPADSIRVVAVVPEGVQVRWALSNPGEIAGPPSGTAAGDTTIAWIARSQKAADPHMTPGDAAERVLRIVPLRSQTANTLLEVGDWAAIGRWWNALSASATAKDLRVDREAAILAGDLSGDSLGAPAASFRVAVADSIYRRMQRDYRYVAVMLGIGGWKPMAAGEVIERKYGDCKGLSAAMAAMLVSRGVPAQLALVRAGMTTPLDAGFPTPTWFNHVIVAVPLGEKAYRFYDPTSTTTPAGRLPWGDLVNPMLVAGGDGGRLVVPPPDAAEPTRAEIAVDLTIHDDLTATSRATLRLTGYLAQDWWHLAVKEKPEPRAAMRRAWLDDAMNPSAQLVNSRLLAATPDSIALDAEYRDARGAQPLSGERFLVRSIGVPRGAQIAIPATSESRKAPLAFPYPFTVRCTVRLRLPAGLAPAADSIVRIETDELRYVRSASIERGGAWEIVRELQLKTAFVKTDRARQFIETLADVERRSEYAVVLGSRR